MSSNDESGGEGGGGGLKTFLLIVVAIVAGFWAIKLTAWLFKTALVVAAVGAVGYLGYSLVRGRLGSDETSEDKPKQLTSEPSRAPAPTPVAADPGDANAEIEEALAELKRLKNMRGE